MLSPLSVNRRALFLLFARNRLAVATLTVAAGLVVLSCTGSGDKTPTAPRAAVASVSVTGAPPDSVLMVGQNVGLVAVLKDASGTTLANRTIMWSSSDMNTLLVSTAGVVTGIKVGVATIRASSEGLSAPQPSASECLCRHPPLGRRSQSRRPRWVGRSR